MREKTTDFSARKCSGVIENLRVTLDLTEKPAKVLDTFFGIFGKLRGSSVLNENFEDRKISSSEIVRLRF